MHYAPYRDIGQLRVAIAAPNAWEAIVIPQGAVNAMLSIESSSASFRVSFDNTVDPATEGAPYGGLGSFNMLGVASAPVTIYVSASEATTAIVQYGIA